MTYEYTIEYHDTPEGRNEIVALYKHHKGMKSGDPHLVPDDDDEVEIIDVVVRTPVQEVSIAWSDLYDFILDQSDLELEILECHIL